MISEAFDIHGVFFQSSLFLILQQNNTPLAYKEASQKSDIKALRLRLDGQHPLVLPTNAPRPPSSAQSSRRRSRSRTGSATRRLAASPDHGNENDNYTPRTSRSNTPRSELFMTPTTTPEEPDNEIYRSGSNTPVYNRSTTPKITSPRDYAKTSRPGTPQKSTTSERQHEEFLQHRQRYRKHQKAAPITSTSTTNTQLDRSIRNQQKDAVSSVTSVTSVREYRPDIASTTPTAAAGRSNPSLSRSNVFKLSVNIYCPYSLYML